MKGLSRLTLKWIALITMLIDHVGAIIGEEVFASANLLWLYYLLRIIGRISFPIFAFFVAEGWFYTHSKKKYFLFMLLFAVIAQVPYYFALNTGICSLNILFTFVLSLLVLLSIDQIKKRNSPFIFLALILLIYFVVMILDFVRVDVSYSVYGVFLPAIFYLFYHKESKSSHITMWVLSALFIVAFWLGGFVFQTDINFGSFLELFALMSLPLLMLYNGQKGKYSMKWFFYIFYVVHITIIYLFTLLI